MLLSTDTAPDNGELESYIARCAAGDREGLALLYEHTRAAVYSFALSILRNVHDAEEVTQDVFVRAFQGAESYRPQGKPLAWLLRIARNLSLDRLRERSKREAVGELELERLTANPRVTAEDRLALEALLTVLGEDERQIVSLHAVAGMKHREIAALMDLALPTVLSKYNRAMKKLQRAWKEAT